MVILSSGAWSDKHLNTFDKTSTVIIEGVYSDTTVKGDVNESDVTELRKYINGQKSTISNFDGVLNVVNGVISNDNITILHKNSIAEDVTILSSSGDYELGYSSNGSLSVSNGSLAYNNVVLEGKSLVHSAELTAIAFKSGVLGVYGGYIVAIGLLLFAFSTAIAWSYYGDRSAAYVFGEKSVIWYRLIYVACFFSAAIIDTEVVWNIAYIIGPLVTVPNIIAMVVMRKEIKSMTSNYVSNNK